VAGIFPASKIVFNRSVVNDLNMREPLVTGPIANCKMTIPNCKFEERASADRSEPSAERGTRSAERGDHAIGGFRRVLNRLQGTAVSKQTAVGSGQEEKR
jgi:hypothetical protein